MIGVVVVVVVVVVEEASKPASPQASRIVDADK